MRPYADDREHLLDHLARVDLLLRRHLERWWADHGGGGDEFRGLYVSDEEVDRLLDPAPARFFAAESSPGHGDVGDGPPSGGGPPSEGGPPPSEGGPPGEVEGASPGGVEGGPSTEAEWTPSGAWHPDDDPDDPDRWGGFTFPGGDELTDRIDAVTREIRERERATAAAGRHLRLVALAEDFDLSGLQRDALLLALAPELDRKYEKVYGYLQDDVTRTRPTVDLLLRVCCPTEGERLAARSAFTGRSPLVRDRLLHLDGDDALPLLSRVVRADERVVDHLLGGDSVADVLAAFTTVVEPSGGADRLEFDQETTTRVERLAARVRGSVAGVSDGDSPQRPPMAYLHGPYGAGKAAAVEVVCADAGLRVLRVEAGGIARDAIPATVRLLAREARLQGAALHVADLHELTEREDADEERRTEDAVEPATVLRALDGVDGPVFVSGEEAVSPRVQARLERHEFETLAFAVPSYERRRDLWRAVDGLPDDVDPADLASKFGLTKGQIADAVSTARTVAEDRSLTRESVYAGCRAQSRERLGTLAQQVETNYTWDDIVLPPDRERELREVAVHVRHQGTVYDEWGFEEKYSLGNGLAVLFAGPSGTGKTMAAEVIAGDAGLDLYRIDLSSVVSKYIGETEKNLRAVFDEAESSNAVLFFDEADAIFGERSAVSDSHDRYANVEVSYLLQRMEAHDGTVVLASNLKENIDDAFMRRINLTVDFPLPDRDSRAAIWRHVFPADAPVDDLDVEFLSSFELPGGNIKNAALTAAFLAAEDGDRVEMRHLVRAVERELRKTGRLVTPDAFGEYQELVEDP